MIDDQDAFGYPFKDSLALKFKSYFKVQRKVVGMLLEF